MIDHYDWAGGREAMWRFGPARGPVVIAALPLFEEANRTRTFTVAILRALAQRGIASALPDLPGQGESLVATDRVTLADWRAAFAAAARALGCLAHGLAIRSGALVDQDAELASRWQFAPLNGDALVRELKRVAAMGGQPFQLVAGRDLHDGDSVEVAGTRMSRTLLRELSVAERVVDGPVRVVRLADDAMNADLRLDGSPLWRRAEPDHDAELASRLADDVAAWISRCAD